MTDELAPQDDSIDSTIADAWEKISADMVPDADDGAAEAETETETDKAARARDEHGRFAPKPDEPTEPVAQQQEAAEPAPDAVKREMPISWRREVAAHWDKIPDAVKDEVLKREADVRRGFESQKQDVEAGRAFRAAVQPFMQTIQQFGTTPEQAATYLFNADHQLRYGTGPQKVAMFRQMADAYGISLAELTGQPADAQADQAPRPTDIEGIVRQVLSGTMAEQQAREREQQQRFMEHQSLTAIADFAYEREPDGSLKVRGYDDTGNPVYSLKQGREDFERLSPMMGALMQANPSLTLEKAYEDARYAHPETRQALLAQQQEQHREDARKKAEQARKAGAVNIRARGALPAQPAPGRMEDTIQAAAQALGLAS